MSGFNTQEVVESILGSSGLCDFSLVILVDDSVRGRGGGILLDEVVEDDMSTLSTPVLAH
jgi:hypothetical protein